jgi:hypothetical protein
VIVVIAFAILGAILVPLAVRAYSQTGNVLALVYATLVVLGVAFGVIALRRNRRGKGEQE